MIPSHVRIFVRSDRRFRRIFYALVLVCVYILLRATQTRHLPYPLN